jgi:hypothetical protein
MIVVSESIDCIYIYARGTRRRDGRAPAEFNANMPEACPAAAPGQRTRRPQIAQNVRSTVRRKSLIEQAGMFELMFRGFGVRLAS